MSKEYDQAVQRKLFNIISKLLLVFRNTHFLIFIDDGLDLELLMYFL